MLIGEGGGPTGRDGQIAGRVTAQTARVARHLCGPTHAEGPCRDVDEDCLIHGARGFVAKLEKNNGGAGPRLECTRPARPTAHTQSLCGASGSNA